MNKTGLKKNTIIIIINVHFHNWVLFCFQGNLFHIDFGHILGNRKRFLGVNRERVPFVLTPDFLYLMGKVKGGFSLNFDRFKVGVPVLVSNKISSCLFIYTFLTSNCISVCVSLEAAACKIHMCVCVFSQDTCMQAYLSLRSHSRLLVTLFSLMLLTGIPELSAASDVDYLRGALQEEGSEEEARRHFLRQVALCEEKGWPVQAMWWIHMVAGIK